MLPLPRFILSTDARDLTSHISFFASLDLSFSPFSLFAELVQPAFTPGQAPDKQSLRSLKRLINKWKLMFQKTGSTTQEQRVCNILSLMFRTYFFSIDGVENTDTSSLPVKDVSLVAFASQVCRWLHRLLFFLHLHVCFIFAIWDHRQFSDTLVCRLFLSLLLVALLRR